MTKLYVIVGPAFCDRSLMVKGFLKSTKENIQLVEESAITKAQLSDPCVPNDNNFRYGMMGVIVRSHLINRQDTVVLGDSLSVEALVLWKRMASENRAEMNVILLEGDQETAMTKLPLPSEVGKQQHSLMVNNLATQFKQFDELSAILTNKLSTIRPDLADKVYGEEFFAESEEEN